jgi:hypothetical protein
MRIRRGVLGEEIIDGSDLCIGFGELIWLLGLTKVLVLSVAVFNIHVVVRFGRS